MKPRPITSVALGLVAFLLVGGHSTAADTTSPAACADCHETIVTEFAVNPHAWALGREGGAGDRCVACHSGAAEHAQSGDPALVATPRGEVGATLCVTCHTGTAQHPIELRSAHGVRGLGCDSCHTMHPAGPPPPALLARAGSGLCVTCHPSAAGSFRKPFAHRLHPTAGGSSPAGMQCASCHNPHGREGAGSLLRSRAGEVVCLDCHTDKRGPFVFTHPATEVGGCLGCHEPHGSANPRMLTRARVAQLCLECHSNTTPATLGSQPPSFHDLRSPRYQNCTTCHVAVHGSNSSPLLTR